MAFALKSKSEGKTHGAEKPAHKRKSARGQHSADSRPGNLPSIVRDVLRSPGQPLDPATQAFMEPRFGQDFSQVRVHTDAKAAESARAVGALAYTVGRDIVFSEGPHTPNMRQRPTLLAHELAHVIQQGRGGVAPEINPVAMHARGAEAAANAAVNRESPVTVSGATGVGLARTPLDLTQTNDLLDLSDWENQTPDLSDSKVWSDARLVTKLKDVEQWRSRQTSSSHKSELADVALPQLRNEVDRRAAVAEAQATVASVDHTLQDDKDDARRAAPKTRPKPRPTSQSLTPEEMCGGRCFTDEEIYGEYNEAKSRMDREASEDAVKGKALFIKKMMEDDRSDWQRRVINLFEKTDPSKRVAVQRHLDMEKLIDAMDDFEASYLGTLGPVTTGHDKLNKKRAAYIKQVIDDFLPKAPDRAEVLVLFALSGVYNDDAYSIFAELANEGRISELLSMPNVAKLIEVRGLQTWGFNDPSESWTAIFPSLGRGLKRMLKDDRPGKYQHQKGMLPREYSRILSQMEMAEFESNLTLKNTVIATIDEITFGVPHGAVDLVRSTASGIGDIAHGEYEKAGEKLSGAAMVLLTHLSAKAWGGARKTFGVTRGQAIFAPNPTAQAAMDRLTASVGRGGVEKAAAYIQADSRAALFVIEHGEAGVYALLEAEGNVATAATKLTSRPIVSPKSSTLSRPEKWSRDRYLAGAIRGALHADVFPGIGAGGTASTTRPVQAIVRSAPARATAIDPTTMPDLPGSRATNVSRAPTRAATTTVPSSQIPPMRRFIGLTERSPSVSMPAPSIAPARPVVAPAPVAPAQLSATGRPVVAPTPTISARQLQTSAQPSTTVWVNTRTRRYHLPGSYWYQRRTAQGALMTLQQARSQGYTQAGTQQTLPPSGVYAVARPNVGDPRVIIRAWIGVREARAGLENEMRSAAEYAIQELAGWQRAHSTGAGLGIESGEAIRLAPELVNQAMQNRGIEAFLRALRDQVVGQGERLHLTTETQTHSGTLRLSSIHYIVERPEGQRMITLFEAVIEVQPDGSARAGIRLPGSDTYTFGPWLRQ